MDIKAIITPRERPVTPSEVSTQLQREVSAALQVRTEDRKRQQELRTSRAKMRK